MSKLFECPGCDGVIDDETLEANNNSCPYCGLSFDNTELVEDLKKGYICPKCADVYSNVDCRNNFEHCKYCGAELIKTDMVYKDLLYSTCDDYIENKDKARITANRYGNFQFSETAYDERWKKIKAEAELRKIKSSQSSSSLASTSSTQPQNIPKCPTCGSTNIRKIKAGERTASIIGFGIFSRKANKTWKCENCGHLW